MDRLSTQVRFGDNVFLIYADDEEGLVDFSFKEMDMDMRNHEEYVANHCIATLNPDELEYLAKRMLDAVEYHRKQKK